MYSTFFVQLLAYNLSQCMMNAKIKPVNNFDIMEKKALAKGEYVDCN